MQRLAMIGTRKQRKKLEENSKSELPKTTQEVCSKLEYELIQAAEKDDLQKVRSLCEAGVNINARSFEKKLMKKKLGVKKLSVDLNSGIDIYKTALSNAILSGSNEVVLYLLQQGANTKQTYPFTCTRIFKRYQKDFVTAIYRNPCYTENLLGMACFSPINNSAFTILLRHTKNINPIVYNHFVWNDSKWSEIKHTCLSAILFDELHDFSGKKVPVDDASTRLTLLICEAILRYEKGLFHKKINYPALLNAKTFQDYIADIELTDSQLKLANTSIQYLLVHNLISVSLGEKLKIVIEEKATAQCKNLPSDASADSTQAGKQCSNGADDHIAYISTHSTGYKLEDIGIELQNQKPDSSQEIAELRKQNQALSEQVVGLAKQQEIMMQKMESLSQQQISLLKQMNILLAQSEKAAPCNERENNDDRSSGRGFFFQGK